MENQGYRPTEEERKKILEMTSLERSIFEIHFGEELDLRSPEEISKESRDKMWARHYAQRKEEQRLAEKEGRIPAYLIL